MKNNNSNFNDTRFFDFEKENNDDPYERGFADKLYEEDPYNEAPAAEDITIDYSSEEDEYFYDASEEEEYPYQEPSQPPRRTYPQQPRPRGVSPYQQVYTPQKGTRFQQEYTPYPQEQVQKPARRVQRAPAEVPEYDRRQAYTPRRPNASQRSVKQSYEPKEKKKHGFFGFLFRLILVLAILFLALLLVLHFIAKPPKGTEALGTHPDDRCTILLAGTDESGDRTDTVMLLNVNRSTKQISLMSIPRDTKVNSTYWPQKINIAYGVNGKGEEGMDSLMDYVSDCVGFRPDGYILLELDAFMDLVDLLGGVDFDVPMDMFYEDASQDLFIDLQQGLQSLDGEEAMELVRYRYGYADADLGRVAVQRDFMLSAIDQWVSWKNIWKAPAAFTMLKSKSTTDLSVSNLVWLAESALICGTDDMYMTTVPFYFSNEYLIVDAGDDYFNLINSHFNPYTENVSWDDVNIAY